MKDLRANHEEQSAIDAAAAMSELAETPGYRAFFVDLLGKIIATWELFLVENETEDMVRLQERARTLIEVGGAIGYAEGLSRAASEGIRSRHEQAFAEGRAAARLPTSDYIRRHPVSTTIGG